MNSRDAIRIVAPSRWRSAARAALVVTLLVCAAGCSSVVGGPPSLSDDPCLACRQNCSLTGRMCGSSSASEMACRSKLADCEYKCRKRYCPRERDAAEPEDGGAGAPREGTPETGQ